MANVSYGVNILPKTNNTYTLGNSDYKWNIYANQINGTNVSSFLTSHQDISGKVDKESGKGLSTNDYTNSDKNAVDNSASVYVIATVQPLGSTASSNYSEGQYIIWGGLPYKVTTAITSGDTLSTQTNLSPVLGGIANEIPKVSNALENKADKVTSATNGNFASLDSNGNLTDSGHKHSDYKTAQTAVSSPSADGTTDAFIDTISQNTNGDISVTKKTVADATTSTHGLMSATDKTKLDGITTMTGATSNTAGASGLVPAPTVSDVDKFLAGDGTYKSGGLPMVILSYGNSTWYDFITAYNNHVIVYCRASSNSNPATGTQGRMAFMAYVGFDNSGTPTNVEFQYYRSMNSHSSTAMGDEVYIYKLTNANQWTVTIRKASVKEIAVSGDGLSSSWSSDKITLTTAAATTSTGGMMSAEDKTKLNEITTALDDFYRYTNIFDPTVSFETGYQSPSGALDASTLVPAKDTTGTAAYGLIMKAIPVIGGKTYAFPKSFVGRLSTYIAEPTSGYHGRSGYVSNTSMTSKTDCLQWTPASNIGYIVIHIWNPSGVTQEYLNNFMILEVDDPSNFVFPTSYVPHSKSIPVSRIKNYDIVGQDKALDEKISQKISSYIFNMYDNTTTLSSDYTLGTSATISTLTPSTTAQTGFATSMKLIEVPGGSTLCMSKDFYGVVGIYNPSGGRSSIYDQNAMAYSGNCRKVTIPSSYDKYYIGIAFSTNWYPNYEYFVFTINVDALPNQFIPHSTKFLSGTKILTENVVGGFATPMDAFVDAFSYSTNAFCEDYAARVQQAQGPNCLTITFKTDSHTDIGYNSQYTDNSVINAMYSGFVGDYLGQDLIVHGGDLLTIGYTTKTTPIHSLRTYLNRMYKFARAPFLVAKGNHDDNCYDTQYTTENYSTDTLIMPEEWNAIVMQYAKKYAVCPTTGRANYCYIDNERTKIRIFILDTEDFDYHVIDGVAEVNSGSVSAFSNDQLNFVANALLFSDKSNPSEWAALFISHRPLDTTTENGKRMGIGDALIRNHDIMLDIITAYRDGTSYSKSGYSGVNQTEINSQYYPYNITIDYSSKGAGEVIGFLFGHVHACNTSNQVGASSSAKSYGYRYVGCGSASFYTLVYNRDTKSIKVFFFDSEKEKVELPATGGTLYPITGLTANDLNEYGDWETSWT